MKKIIIAGATGLIGQALVKNLINKNYEVVTLGRNKSKALALFDNAVKAYEWSPNDSVNRQPEEWSNELNGNYAIVNLAGESLVGRWTKRKKEKILRSRVESTELLRDAARMSAEKPSVYIGASAIGYYGNTGNKEVNELMPRGEGFLSDVVANWERAQREFEAIGARRVTIRIGMVLSMAGGALPKMALPFKFFIGGPLGSGKQWISWVHISDLVKIFIQALEDDELSGVINASSPNPVTMSQFARTIGSVMHRPSLFKVPEFMLKIILGEAAQLITDSTKVHPALLIKHGFIFDYPALDKALADLLKD